MKKALLTIASILMALTGFAQFTLQGKIEYERKMNVHRAIDFLDEDEKRWADKYKQQLARFHTTYFDLYFSSGKSIYKPGREVEDNPKTWYATPPDMSSLVLTDTKTGKLRAQKQIYEETFLLEDSMKKLKWKIYDEIRTVADYKCRKAVTIICDSVYVVAFYTEDIPVSSGPEMFGGLPGMIMQLAIPRLNTTWTATTVQLMTPTAEDFSISEKGKATNMQQLHENVYSNLKRWGKSFHRFVWWAVL